MDKKIIMFSILIVFIFTITLMNSSISLGNFDVKAQDMKSINKVMEGQTFKVCNFEANECVFLRNING